MFPLSMNSPMNSNCYVPQTPQFNAMPPMPEAGGCNNNYQPFPCDMNGCSGPGSMWGGEQAPDLGGVFGNFQNDHAAFSASRPEPYDNQANLHIKGQYREGYEKASMLRNDAVSEASHFGPGEHQLPNGENVKVSDPDSSGKVTVTTKDPNGGVRSTTYNTNDPSYVDSTHLTANGGRYETKREGDNVSLTSQKSFFDAPNKTSFHLENQDGGVGIVRSNGTNKQVANADGSSTQSINLGFFSPITHTDPPAQPEYGQQPPPFFPQSVPSY